MSTLYQTWPGDYITTTPDNSHSHVLGGAGEVLGLDGMVCGGVGCLLDRNSKWFVEKSN